MKQLILSLTLTATLASFCHAGETVMQQMGRAQDTIAQLDFLRFQREEEERAAKIQNAIREAEIARQAAKEQQDAEMEKEIERCLTNGLPCPTEATWHKSTGAEQARAKFEEQMWDQMNARIRLEH